MYLGNIVSYGGGFDVQGDPGHGNDQDGSERLQAILWKLLSGDRAFRQPCKFIGTKESVYTYIQNSSTPTGLISDTNMVAVSLLFGHQYRGRYVILKHSIGTI